MCQQPLVVRNHSLQLATKDEMGWGSLMEINEHGENCQIGKVIKERATNIKLKFEDAWTLLTEIYNKSWGTKYKIRKKYNIKKIRFQKRNVK